jgi:hypothetical protein
VTTSIYDRLFADCRALARRHFSGDLVLTDAGSFEQWDRSLHRQVLSQSIVIYERLCTVNVLIDRDDQPVGFVDEAEWRGCAWREMGDDEVLDLVRETAIVDGELRVLTRHRDQEDALRATVEEIGANGERYRLNVCINPSAPSIIAIVPADEELP